VAQSALMPSCPALMAVGGPAATAKPSLTRALAMRSGFLLGARLLTCPAKETASAGFGGGWLPYLRTRLRGNPYETMLAEARAALAAGLSVVCHAPFGRIAERAAVRKTAASAGVPFAGMWLNRPPRTEDAEAAPRRRGRPVGSSVIPDDWHRIDTVAAEPERNAAVSTFVGSALAGTNAAAAERRPAHRELLARMSERLSVDRSALARSPQTLRLVEERCSSCQAKVRCREFLARPERSHPDSFCPNASVLQELAPSGAEQEPAQAAAT
jgi:hypothetical protein